MRLSKTAMWRNGVKRMMLVLLCIADLLPEDRADALRDRVQRMDQAQEILRQADF